MIAHGREPQLLIKQYTTPADLKKRIVESRVKSIHPQLPMCRLRGTAIYPDERTLIGWQRNISRLRKMDVSLPTIITIRLSPDDTIAEIELDKSFKGSKGLMCSRNYLDGNLKKYLIGAKMDDTLDARLKQKHLHCFHLVEVLLGARSFFHIHRNKYRDVPFCQEQEILDFFSTGSDFFFEGLQDINGETRLRYSLHFADILRKIAFDPSGNLSRFEDIETTFTINAKELIKKVIHLGDRSAFFKEFIFKCIHLLSSEMYPGIDRALMNTNLFPPALLSLLIQACAMHLFNNNYNYVMHVLTALQRRNNVPGCVGALKDESEARRYFPGFDLGEMLSHAI